MSVYMPIPKGYKVRVTELTIKPGETITLYNPEVAVESEAMTRLDGLIRVDTPTCHWALQNRPLLGASKPASPG